ncbi:MAG: hypothetical protein KKD18_06430 [Nanoarchaeota archaeon]|nr:hypothetical protein [Nanoarchaeota archaeon]MBU0978029.1 hypothetical protein [Nanoarchaeota archaeon]
MKRLCSQVINPPIRPEWSRRVKAQISVYVIIALVLVLLIVFLYVLRSNVGQEDIPQELRPVFDYYQECIRSEAALAVNLAGAGGGRIFIEDYVPGSEYAPFASHLNFLGSPVKYWYFIQGNGIIQESVPTKSDIEAEIARFVEGRLKNCKFDYYYSQGYNISLGDPIANVVILENKVEVNVDSGLAVSREGESAEKNDYLIEVTSKLGKFYNLALDIYNDEKQNAFLEDYAVDVLYNYAPVSGVEIQCGPKIWLTQQVMDDLRTGLQENIQTIKFEGSYYKLTDDKRKYFVHDLASSEAVNLLYLKDWPSRIEINGDGVDDEIMVGEPVGTDAGMGAMGFCYIPYHFIYDMQFPVMVQLYDGNELFQYPIVVVIDKNVPRKALSGEAYVDDNEFQLCEFMSEDMTVNLYDSNLNRVDGNVSFECFNQKCRLGESQGGVLRTGAPACVNGYLHVRADGFADKKQIVSTNRENFVEVILERERDLDVSLFVGGRKLKDEIAIVSFTKDDGSVKTLAYPEQNKVALSEGSYEVKVYVYGNSSITLPASSKTQCVEVPRGGLLGLLGSTKEQCFDINIPATKIDSALIGGGILNTYLLDSELAKGKLEIRSDRLPKPTSIDKLAENFEVFETKRLYLEFDGS